MPDGDSFWSGSCCPFGSIDRFNDATGVDADERLFSWLILWLTMLFVVAVGGMLLVLVLFTLFTRQPISPLMLISGTLRLLFSPMVAVVVFEAVVDTSVVVSVDADVV